jgi:DNA-binding XRE family transcriptional regulator
MPRRGRGSFPREPCRTGAVTIAKVAVESVRFGLARRYFMGAGQKVWWLTGACPEELLHARKEKWKSLACGLRLAFDGERVRGMGRTSTRETPLANLRKETGLSQAGFAALFGLEREYLSKLEGKNEVDPKIALTMLENFMRHIGSNQSTQGDESLNKDCTGKIHADKNGVVSNENPWNFLASLAMNVAVAPMPVDFTIEAEVVDRSIISEIQKLLANLALLYEGESRPRVRIVVTHDVPHESSRLEICDNLQKCLYRNSIEVERGEKLPADGGAIERFRVRGIGADTKPVEVSVEGLDRFPKRKKTWSAKPGKGDKD